MRALEVYGRNICMDARQVHNTTELSEQYPLRVLSHVMETVCHLCIVHAGDVMLGRYAE